MDNNLKIFINNISRLNKHIFVYLNANIVKDNSIKKAKINKIEKLEEKEPSKETKTFKIIVNKPKKEEKSIVNNNTIKELINDNKKEETNSKEETFIDFIKENKKEKVIDDIAPIIEDKKEPKMLFGIKEEPKKELETTPQIIIPKEENRKIIDEPKPFIKETIQDIPKTSKNTPVEIKTEPVLDIKKEPKKEPFTKIDIVNTPKEFAREIKEEKDTLELNIKEIENRINNRLYNSNYIYINRIEKDITELQDKVLLLQDKIINSDDPKEIEEYVKELKRIIEKINEILKELDRVNELIDIKVEDIKNEDEFLLKFDTYTKKLKNLEKEIIPKVEDEANIKIKLINDLDKENEDKISELDRQTLELNLISKKLDNDLNFYIELTKEIQRTTEVTERVERTYNGLNRLMNTFMNNMLLVGLAPVFLKGPAMSLAHINSTLNIAGEMLNPTFIEHRVYDRKVNVEEETDLVLDVGEVKDVKKQIDDINKKLDYIMSEISKTFKGYEDKYKEIFDKIKEAKSIIDKQLEQISTLEKQNVKVLKIEKKEE